VVAVAVSGGNSTSIVEVLTSGALGSGAIELDVVTGAVVDVVIGGCDERVVTMAVVAAAAPLTPMTTAPATIAAFTTRSRRGAARSRSRVLCDDRNAPGSDAPPGALGAARDSATMRAKPL